MYIVGEEEAEAVARVIRSGALFRYREDSECERFERSYAAYLGAEHFSLAVSGTFGLYAGLVGMGIGPGDEVIVPTHTYVATATAVLGAGAIPVIVDVDESLTLDADALRDAIGPRTKAVIPVHMWGQASNMEAIMDIATKHGLLVLEDACQAVGGSYHDRKLGTIGQAGAFSFNYFKNITAGEAGGLVTNDRRIAERARAAIDPCNFYWQGHSDSVRPFGGVGARASELTGAMLNVQLGRLDDILAAMRREKQRVLAGIAQLGNIGLAPAKRYSGTACASRVILQLPSEEAANRFVERVPGLIAGKTGRHNVTEWDQVLSYNGAHHPALNPYTLPENAGCRTTYPDDLGRRSLDIVSRTVLIAMHPLHSDEESEGMSRDITAAARAVLDTPRQATPRPDSLAEVRRALLNRSDRAPSDRFVLQTSHRNAIGLRTVLEQDHGGNAADTEPGGVILLVVRVELQESGLRLDGARRLLVFRCHGMAGPAPGRPHIDDHRHAALADLPLQHLGGHVGGPAGKQRRAAAAASGIPGIPLRRHAVDRSAGDTDDPLAHQCLLPRDAAGLPLGPQ